MINTNLIKSLDTKTLLALYNALTGKSTSKFASRKKGEVQTMGAAKVAGQEVVAAELAKLGVDVAVNPLTPKAKPAATYSTKPISKRHPENTRVVPFRASSKYHGMVSLMSRKEGATMEELYDCVASRGKAWPYSTIRGAIITNIYERGYEVESSWVDGCFIVRVLNDQECV